MNQAERIQARHLEVDHAVEVVGAQKHARDVVGPASVEVVGRGTVVPPKAILPVVSVSTTLAAVNAPFA